MNNPLTFQVKIDVKPLPIPLYANELVIHPKPPFGFEQTTYSF